MGYRGEAYCQNTGCVCEKCASPDTKSRLVIFDTGASSLYLCVRCLEDSAIILRSKIVYLLSSWTMSRVDAIGWMDPAGRTTGPNPEHLRGHVSTWMDEVTDLGKKLISMNMTRDEFFIELRKKTKWVYNVVDEYLKKT